MRDIQVAALDERFQERKDCLKLLGHRANEAGITEIRGVEDMVPLLFPHTAYKSYPESFLMEETVGPADQLARHGLALSDRGRRSGRYRRYR